MLTKIAFRNILRQRRRSLLTALTMLGGFVLASISIAWQDGSYAAVIDRFTRLRLGHIQIHTQAYRERPSLYRTIDAAAIGAVLDGEPRVEAWTPRIFAGGIAAVGEKTTGVQIYGVDPAREHATTLFDSKIVGTATFFRSPAHQALLGEVLARRLQAKVGDDIVLLSQAADGSLANDIYTVRGLINTGDPAGDQTTVYLHIEDAQELLVLRNRVHEIAIVAHTPKRLRAIATDIVAALDDSALLVEPWQDFNRSFYDAMKTDERGNWIAIAVIIIVVAVGVLNTVLMSVLERRREYGLLRALGTKPRQIFALVTTEAAMLGLMSVAAGAVVALGINYWLSITGVDMPMELTIAGVEFNNLKAELNWRSYIIPAIVVMFAALVVSMPAALRAARTAPATAMRMH